MIKKNAFKNLEIAVNELIKNEEIIVFHSSLSKLGFKNNDQDEEKVLKLLKTILNQGKTIVLPSFNFSTPKTMIFDVDKNLSETGKLAEIAFKKLDFKRTLNPMFSFVIKGPKEKDLMLKNNFSGYGKDTVVERLANEDVCIIMLGASWETCTLIHNIEEKNNVSYREYKSWEFKTIINDEKSSVNHFELFVRKPLQTRRLRFDKIQENLKKSNKLRSILFDETLIEASNGLDIYNIANMLIKKDEFYFVEKTFLEDE